MRARDRSAVDRATATLADEQIGRTRHRTPEGYLLCEGARIARTGPMLYRADEMPDIEVGPYGRMITILRDADVLFAPETILSFAGKDVTNDHPDENIGPHTYKQVTVGTVLNPRQGEGTESQYLLADLLIKDMDAIAAVEADKVQLSPGYDCEVEQIRPGIGRQIFVLGNHVALVDQGRGGPFCSIQDGDYSMATRKQRIMTGLRAALKAKDEAAFETELEKAGVLMDDEGDDAVQRLVIEVQQPAPVVTVEPVVADPTDPIEARFSALESSIKTIADAVAALVPPAEPVVVADEDPDADEEDDKTVAMDAASKAEILAPGIRLPTFDSAKVKRAAITSVRRNALSTAYADANRRPVIDSVLGGRAADFGKMRSTDLATVFDAAAAVMAANNNHSRPRTVDIPQGPMTAARMQQLINDRRAKA